MAGDSPIVSIPLFRRVCLPLTVQTVADSRRPSAADTADSRRPSTVAEPSDSRRPSTVAEPADSRRPSTAADFADSRRPSAAEPADAHAAAALQARRAVADHPTAVPALLSPPLSTARTHTPDSDAVAPASGSISVKELATPLSDMQRRPTQESVAPQAGSVGTATGTPELIHDSAFLPTAKCEIISSCAHD